MAGVAEVYERAQCESVNPVYSDISAVLEGQGEFFGKVIESSLQESTGPLPRSQHVSISATSSLTRINILIQIHITQQMDKYILTKEYHIITILQNTYIYIIMGYFFHYEFPDMFLGSLLYILLVVLSDSKMKRNMMMMKSLCVVETEPIVTDFGSLTLTFSVLDSLTWIWTVSVSDSWTVSVLDSWTWTVSVAFLDSLTWTWTVSVSVSVSDSWTVSVLDSWTWTVSVAFLDSLTWTWTVSVSVAVSDSWIWTVSVSVSDSWIWTVSVLDSWTWTVSVAFLDSLTWTWTVSVSVAVLDSWTWTVSVSVSDSWIWTVSVLDYGTWTECCSSWMDCGFWSDSVWLTVFCLFDSYHDSAVSVLE